MKDIEDVCLWILKKEFFKLPERDYDGARNLSLKIAADLGAPRFYLHEDQEVARSQQLFDFTPMVKDCLGVVAGYGDCYGHGLSHIQKVAVDAGAIVLIELNRTPLKVDTERLVLLVHLAGLLHDIKRSEKDHARMGAREASMILKNFPMEDRECSAITQAIANHEAFQTDVKLDEPAAQLLSDALYDADKFRWGPDNFTETLWAMLASRKATLEAALPRFLKGLEGIRRIRGTFRTPTGKLYGPDFIDRGLEIGKRFYNEITHTGQEICRNN
jgi:hypothetical protein